MVISGLGDWCCVDLLRCALGEQQKLRSPNGQRHAAQTHYLPPMTAM
jgi:hypothetical protein